jgi:DNA-directed RNA polymerase subunit RPC12/RpoP
MDKCVRCGGELGPPAEHVFSEGQMIEGELFGRNVKLARKCQQCGHKYLVPGQVRPDTGPTWLPTPADAGTWTEPVFPPGTDRSGDDIVGGKRKKKL